LKNLHDGRAAEFPIGSIGKIIRNKGFDVSKIIDSLPKLYEESLLAWSQQEIKKEGHKYHPNISEYHNYINKFTDGTDEYFIRFTITETKTKTKTAGKNLIHSTAISDVSIYRKGDASQRIRDSNPGEAKSSPFIDTRLQQFFDSVNPSDVSQVRDENGEPMVVYHGTNEDFDIFDQTRAKAGQYGDGFYFTPDRDIAHNYGDKVIAAFINARIDSREARRTGREKDHLHTKDGTDYWVVKNPEQIKSATDNVGTFSNETPSVLFQLTHDEAMDEGRHYRTWQAWRDADEANALFGLEPSSPDGMSSEERDTWYKEAWQEANGKAGRQDQRQGELFTSSQIDEKLLDKWRDDEELDKWLKTINQARQESVYDTEAQDEDETQIREYDAKLRDRINREVHPTILMAAKRLDPGNGRSGKPLADTQRRQVMTLLEEGIPFYRDLYTELTGDREFTRYAENEIQENRHVETAKQEDLSIYQKQQLAKNLQNEEIRKKYEAGQITEDETQKYITALKEEKKDLESELRKTEKELAGDEAQLRKDEKIQYLQKKEIAQGEKTLLNYEKEIVRLEKELAKQKVKGKQKTDDARAARIQKYETRIHKLTEKARELRAEVTHQKAETEMNISLVRAEEALAKDMALGRLKAQMKTNEAEHRAAARIIAERRKKIKRIQKNPGAGIWHTYRNKIKAIQAAFTAEVNPTDQGKNITWAGKPISVTAFRDMVAKGEIDAGLLNKRLQDRLARQDLNELHDSDLDELLVEINALKSEGRAVWEEMETRRINQVASTIAQVQGEINRLKAEGKTPAAKRMLKYLEAKTTEEREKIAESADSKFTKAIWEGWRDAELFKTMDGGAEGIISELFRDDGNKAKRDKWQNYDRRVDELFAFVKEKDFDIEKAKKTTVTVEGLGPDGIAAVLSIPKLMLINIGLNNEKMRQAILFGDFLSLREREQIQDMISSAVKQDKAAQKAAVQEAKKQAKEAGEKFKHPKKMLEGHTQAWAYIDQIAANKEALVKKAIAENLTEKELSVAQFISDNFAENFPRIKDIFFQMFNQDVGDQISYLPMNRTASSGDIPAGQEKREALNIGTHAVSVSADDGMMQERVDIPPWGQTPIELDIFKVFFQGVEREEHFAAFGPYIRKLNAVFKQKYYGADVMQDDLTVMYGKFAMNRLRDHINILGAPDSIRSDTAENYINAMSGNAALAEIGFNVASYLAQYPQSAAAFFGHVNLGEYLTATLEKIKHPKAFNDWVMEKSTVMRHRIINYAQEYLKGLKERGKLTAAQMKIAEIGMKMQEAADRQTVSIGWWAVYQKEIKKNGGDEEAAIAKADKVVLETQPTMEESEVAPIFRGGKGHLPKALTRYGVPLNVIWNQITHPIYNIASTGIPNAIKNKTIQNLIGVYAAFGIANALVALARGKLSDDDDDDEEKMKKLMYYLLASPLAESVPLISSLTGWAAERVISKKKPQLFRQNLYPMAELGVQSIVEWTELEDAKDFKKALRKAIIDTMSTTSYALGLPANQLRKIITGYEAKSFWPVIGFKP
jgi:hypothetical protein